MMWTILGFGALGGVIACQLQHAGQHVRVILPRKFNSQATSMVNFHDYQAQRPLRLAIEFHSPTQPIREGALIIATKGYDVIPALEAWKPYIAPKIPIFLLNNGMGVDAQARTLLPDNIIITGVTELGAMHREHCSFTMTGQGPIWLGIPDKTEDAHVAKAVHCFKTAIPQSHWTHFIQSRQWQKLTLNSVINPLTSKYNIKNGALLEPEFKPIVQALCDELTRLSDSMQLQKKPISIMDNVFSLAQKTCANSSSMRQDILHQRKTEIDLMTGYILQQAEQFHVDMPTHSALYQDIKRLEATYGT